MLLHIITTRGADRHVQTVFTGSVIESYITAVIIRIMYYKRLSKEGYTQEITVIRKPTLAQMIEHYQINPFT